MRREVVGARLRDLMLASMRYSFSEDRMTDGTHVTPDNRGVDRTSIFEGLVTSCARACVALQDLEFLFEDLFQQYDDHGISGMFLKQLEPFVLNNQIREVPPRITQRLVAMHDEDGRPDLVERVIWHIDPACLDINQTIQLCQQHQLYDALIYIYTRAMKDYVSPVVELLGLIRKVHQYRKRRSENPFKDSPGGEDTTMESIILNAYKVYPYLANVLSGLSYPSAEPLDEEEAFQAKKDVYTFLFYGRSSVWPAGDAGKLVLTSDEEGGAEPTFPYARTLLRFDAESFLHTLDIAFEDSFLNDETQGVSRLVIVKTLLEILASSTSPALAPATVTFVNIFVARNVPKYPQFIQIAPSVSQSILTSLAQDPDVDTREDRQLAAEYLLSVYTPHEGDRILKLFDAAGFFRILRSWYRHEKRWAPLLSTYLRDPDMHAPELFGHVDEVLDTASGLNKGKLPRDLLASLEDSLSQLLRTSVIWTASILDKHASDLHRMALDILEEDLKMELFPYLLHLLGRPQSEDDEYVVPSLHPRPSLHIPKDLRQLFIRLQCQHDPGGVIDALKHLPSDDLDLSELLRSCEDLGAYDAVVWALNWKGDPRGALSKAELYEEQITLKIVLLFEFPMTPQSTLDVEQAIKALESVSRTAMSVCVELSKQRSVTDIPLEDVWFHLLRSQITCVQNVSSCYPQTTSSKSDDPGTAQIHQRTLSSLRSLLQESFTSLASMSSTRAVSFPILFKRLVDSATQSHSSNHATYTEFRTILSGMLESYHSEGDMLQITKRLIDRDLFETVEVAAGERVRGWAPSTGSCSICLQALLSHRDPTLINRSTPEDTGKSEIVVSRTGMIYHEICSTTNS
jgi:vacuolar protein sorting-associated protein 8